MPYFNQAGDRSAGQRLEGGGQNSLTLHLTRMIRVHRKDHHMFARHGVLGMDIKQGRGHGGDFQALLQDLRGDEEGGRNRFQETGAVDSQPGKGYATCQRPPSLYCPIRRVFIGSLHRRPARWSAQADRTGDPRRTGRAYGCFSPAPAKTIGFSALAASISATRIGTQFRRAAKCQFDPLCTDTSRCLSMEIGVALS